MVEPEFQIVLLSWASDERKGGGGGGADRKTDRDRSRENRMKGEGL